LDLITLGVARTPTLREGRVTPAAARGGVPICWAAFVVVLVIVRSITAVHFKAPRKIRWEAARGPGSVHRAWKRLTRVALALRKLGLGSAFGA
jgi:hypothetical protein